MADIAEFLTSSKCLETNVKGVGSYYKSYTVSLRSYYKSYTVSLRSYYKSYTVSLSL